jgi:excisionase family DNA binding protein
MSKKAKMAVRATGEQPADLQKLLTVADVCTILRVSRVKVYDLIKRDGLPSVKINGARRIQPGRLQHWIEQHSE